MAEPDFYKILGVPRSASPDEIKSAHRELVKIFHPDLFSTSAEKARANRKLQQINEAYATLSNAGRRRQYDARISKSGPAAAGPSAATKRSPDPAPPPLSAAKVWAELTGRFGNKLRDLKQTYRVLAEAERRRAKAFQQARNDKRTRSSAGTWTRGFRRFAEFWRGSLKHWRRPVSRTVTAVGTGSILLLMVVSLNAVLEEPQTETAWALLESAVDESAPDVPHERKWTALGRHETASACAESLKQQAKADEHAGGKVLLDERTGTIAMTIYVKTEAALTREYLDAKLKQMPFAPDRQLLEQQAKEEAREFIRKNGLAQRVKHYQCREVRWVKPDSWLRSQLKRLGLVT